jgi:hypothetical protein
MSRGQTSAYNDELEAVSKTPILFFEGEFTGGIVRLWSGLGTISWDGNDWAGAGALAKISPIRDESNVSVRGMTVTLRNIDNAWIPAVLAEAKSGAYGKVWTGFIDDDGSVVADPLLSFVGRLDVPSISDSGGKCRVTISYENRMRDFRRKNVLRYTHDSQQRLYPGDLGFEYVPSLQEAKITWGRG